MQSLKHHSPTRDVFTFTFKTDDPYDALIRSLNDAQRIGAELVNQNFDAADGILSMSVRLGGFIDPQNFADRLGRHLSIDLIDFAQGGIA